VARSIGGFRLCDAGSGQCSYLTRGLRGAEGPLPAGCGGGHRHRSVRALRTASRLRCRRDGVLRARGRRGLCIGRLQDVDLEWRHRGFLLCVCPHRPGADACRRFGPRAGHQCVRGGRGRAGPAHRGAHRVNVAAPAGDAALQQLPGCRPPAPGRGRGRISSSHCVPSISSAPQSPPPRSASPGVLSRRRCVTFARAACSARRSPIFS
jgi:hypothetical protein